MYHDERRSYPSGPSCHRILASHSRSGDAAVASRRSLSNVDREYCRHLLWITLIDARNAFRILEIFLRREYVQCNMYNIIFLTNRFYVFKFCSKIRHTKLELIRDSHGSMWNVRKIFKQSRDPCEILQILVSQNYFGICSVLFKDSPSFLPSLYIKSIPLDFSWKHHCVPEFCSFTIVTISRGGVCISRTLRNSRRYAEFYADGCTFLITSPPHLGICRENKICKSRGYFNASPTFWYPSLYRYFCGISFVRRMRLHACAFTQTFWNELSFKEILPSFHHWN